MKKVVRVRILLKQLSKINQNLIKRISLVKDTIHLNSNFIYLLNAKSTVFILGNLPKDPARFSIPLSVISQLKNNNKRPMRYEYNIRNIVSLCLFIKLP